MAENKVGEAVVEVTADTSGVDRGVDRAKAKTEELGDAGKKSSEKLSGGFSQAGNAASRLQSAVSKILIPVALVSSVGGLVRQFRALREQAEAFRKANAETLSAINRQTQDLAFSLRQLDDLQQRQIQNSRSLQDDLANIQKQREAILNADANLFESVRRLIGESIGVLETQEEKLKALQKLEDAAFKAREERERLLFEENKRRDAERARLRKQQIEDETRAQLESIEEVRRAAEAAFSPLNQGSFAVGLQGLNDRLQDIVDGLRRTGPITLGGGGR